MLASPHVPALPLHPRRTTTTACLPSHHHHIDRTHNSKSTALLLRHLNNTTQQQQKRSSHSSSIPAEDKARILELSLTNTATPHFPGSIYNPQNAPLPPLHSLFQTLTDDEEENRMVMKAVEIRRKVTVEIFMSVMIKKGKFGITYTGNLVGCVGEFIDYVMVRAAVLKGVPEFEGWSFNERAGRVIEDSGVVPLVRWLKHNGLTYPQIGKLICMSKGNLESIRRRAEWLKSIHVRGSDIGVVVIKAGGNILERSDDELDKIVEYLESNGVRSEWMGHVMTQSPQLLSYSMDEVKSQVGFYVDMGMNEKDFGTMVFEYPKALGSLSLEEMNQKVDYLKEFGLSKEEVGRLLAFRPHLMRCSIEERWKPLVKYLYYLGITRDGMKKMLTRKPMVFCFDMEITVVPKVQFFRDIGVRDDAIGHMLVKFPSLLTYSLNKKIRPVLIFLMTKAGVSEKNMGKVIALGPELLGCSIAHKLDINVKYFLSLGIRLRQLGEMIADFPMLLRYNVEVFRPKYRYLRRTMARPLKDLIEFPRFFSYSLEGRIIPRHEVLVQNRINFKLRYMLSWSDEEFNQRVESAVDRRKRFESGLGVETSISSLSVDESLEESTTVDTSDAEVAFSSSEGVEEVEEVDSDESEDPQSLDLHESEDPQSLDVQ